MNHTAYLVVEYNRGTLKLTSAGIFNEPHPTQRDPIKYGPYTVLQATATSYAEAEKKLRKRIVQIEKRLSKLSPARRTANLGKESWAKIVKMLRPT